MTETLTGRCMCGGVRYEVTGPLGAAGYCHCHRCQRRTGGASSAQVRTTADALRITRGEELVKFYAPPGGFEKAFCTECGSALFSRNPEDPGVMAIRLGTFDTDPGVRPAFRQWTAEPAPWEPIPDDGLERFSEGRPPA